MSDAATKIMVGNVGTPGHGGCAAGSTPVAKDIVRF